MFDIASITNHPAAELFPMLDSSALNELAEDIRKNGLLEPVIIYHGQVLDGRNRLAACDLAGVSPQFIEMDGNLESPVLYVISRNLHRRHLSVSQRACIAAEMVPLLQEEAKERQGGSGRFGSARLHAEPADKGREGRAANVAAKAAGVGETSVTYAIAAKRDNPEGFEKAKRGELTVSAAAEGHTAPPKRGNGIPKDVTTPRGQQLAEGQKARMITALSTANGICVGLEKLDVEKVAAVCDESELREWADKAREIANNFRAIAKRLESKQ